jgi:hypothetical protein
LVVGHGDHVVRRRILINGGIPGGHTLVQTLDRLGELAGR